MTAGAVKAGEAFVDISANLGPLEKSIGQLQQKLQSVGATFAKVGAGLTAAGVAIGSGLGFAIKEAGKFETVTTQFTTLLGSAEKATAVLKELNNFSLVTPFTPDAVNQAGKALLHTPIVTGKQVRSCLTP